MEPHDAAVGLEGRRHPASNPSGWRAWRLLPQSSQCTRGRFFQPSGRFHFLTCTGGVSCLHVVGLPYGKRVEFQRLGDFVHLLFISQSGLWSAESTEGAGEGLIGGNSHAVHMQVVDPVRTGRHTGGVKKHIRCEIRIRAGIGHHLDVTRGDPSVLLDAGSVCNGERMPLGRGGKRLLPRVDELHRTAGLACQEGEEDLHGDVFLASESAADHGASNANSVLRHIQRTGNRSKMLDHLRAYTDVDHALLVDPRYTGIWFEIGMFHERHGERVLDNRVSFRHACVEVALADLVFGHHVVGRKQNGSPRLHGFDRIKHSRQLFQLEIDEPQCGFSDLQALGCDQGDWFSYVSHDVRRQHRCVRSSAGLATGLAG